MVDQGFCSGKKEICHVTAGPYLSGADCGGFRQDQVSALRQEFKEGQRIFSEGGAADYIYVIESGRISIFLQKFTVQEEIGVLGPANASAKWPSL